MAVYLVRHVHEFRLGALYCLLEHLGGDLRPRISQENAWPHPIPEFTRPRPKKKVASASPLVCHKKGLKKAHP